MTNDLDPDDLDGLRAFLASAPLLDGHNDLLWELRCQAGYDLDRLDIRQAVPSLQTDLPRLRAGGVGAQFWSVYAPSDLPGDAAVLTTLEQLDAWRAVLERYPDRLQKALGADDVERAVRGGRIASLAGMEGGHCIGGSLGALRAFYALGARYLTLTHNDNTSWADSATDEPRHHGLSPFGEDVVAEMNRIGMAVDLSHVAVTTMHATLGVTRAPVLFSHSSARALCDHPRNVPDDVLGRLHGNGGVCMVTFVPGFVSQPIADLWREAAALEQGWIAQLPDDRQEVTRRVRAWRAAHPYPPATLQQVADHIDHVRDVAGVAHVGIGGDFDGCPEMPVGLHDVSCYPALFAELRRRHWNRGDLRALAGGNALRVLRAVRQVADSTPAWQKPPTRCEP